MLGVKMTVSKIIEKKKEREKKSKRSLHPKDSTSNFEFLLLARLSEEYTVCKILVRLHA